MQKLIYVNTDSKEGAFDITAAVVKIVRESEATTGIVNLFVQGATAGLAIQESREGEVQRRNLLLLETMTRNGIAEANTVASDEDVDKNDTAHMKASILGPSKTLPIVNGKIGISIWQNIFLYEFDGPRKNRTVVVTVISSN